MIIPQGTYRHWRELINENKKVERKKVVMKKPREQSKWHDSILQRRQITCYNAIHLLQCCSQHVTCITHHFVFVKGKFQPGSEKIMMLSS